MHNHQHLKTNNISKLAVIALSIVLITGIFLLPAIHLGVYGQQQQPPPPQQQNQILPAQVIKQIAQQVATTNPGTNATHVYQILVQLAKQTAQTSSQTEAIKDIHQISSQVTAYPFGTVSQSLAHLAQQPSASSDGGRSRSSSTNAIQVAQQIAQEKSSTGQNISESVITKAVQIATGANSSNVKQPVRHAAQLLANRAGVPVEKVEAVIIQIALQISQEQGKAITAQSLSHIVNQIAQNPNGVIAQAILKIVKQYADDNGKTGKTVNIIDNMMKSGGGNSKTIPKMIGDRGEEGGRDGPLQSSNSGLEPDNDKGSDDGVVKVSREDGNDKGGNDKGGNDKGSDDGVSVISFLTKQKQKLNCFIDIIVNSIDTGKTTFSSSDLIRC
ncbi:MAG TPA: hypothetical protein VE818_08310 [Nitrososphaeraceae archaeon]|nr:hypothetical protein [Nitrososphaeraceae archaeon]